ncbi:hypothetical protein M378DRAFT_82539, partial [Amanita muscaria Koide BX008]
CSFSALQIFRHELNEKYCWYWRVEYVLFHVTHYESPVPNYSPTPEVHFHCNINFNTLLFMEE